MAKYRHNLPQLSNDLFLTDGGLETTLIFHQGFDLPDFAAFDLLRHEAGYWTIRNYFDTYIRIATEHQLGFILESPTWRANPDWGTRLGYTRTSLAEMNKQAIALLHDLRQIHQTAQTPMVISGCIGPRGDGYLASNMRTANMAEDYHRTQIEIFRDSDADLVTAMTINYVEEAIGIVNAARSLNMPVVISFTVETDGRLPSGQSLKNAIAQVDQATDQFASYYMINCAHPSHFAQTFTPGESWLERVRGIRANASTQSHAELNESETLDDGNPKELGELYRQLRQDYPQITILGGCCGTDHRHVEAICKACLPVAWSHLSRSRFSLT
ncbi:MAG: homocysteine S-methyltransferase family protein [Leptolyngbyaceae cyanobacterium bins.349]|nr:homocysteine S-methyltransferase family protein [Leptolyngbyaceae cyanobacterium bins.349]